MLKTEKKHLFWAIRIFFNLGILVKKFVDSYLENSWKHVMSSIIAWFKVTYDRGRRNWIKIDSTKTEAYQIGKMTNNKFIRWFHQSWIPNLLIFVTNICYDLFFSTGKLREKTCFEPKKVLEIFPGKISKTYWWKHLMNS